jgi:hypothetical protein
MMENQENIRQMASKGVMWLLVGLSLIAAGIGTGRQLHIVWNIWPSVDGVVVGGTVQEVLQAAFAKGGMPTHVYSPKVEFRYMVGGTPYTTTAPSVYTSDSYKKAAENLRSMYAPGTHHPIRYNPREPHDIRFGIIEFGPLVFSFLLLVGGVILGAGGVNSLVSAYSRRLVLAPVVGRGVPATILPFEDRSRVEPAAATLRCPACGRPVEAGQDTCPNCLKFLRAA